MPPREYSRHSYTIGYEDTNADAPRPAFLSGRIPWRFRQRDDNRLVIAKTGDTLWALAGRYFSELPRACGLWWIIGDFQPEPIHDPTLQLAPGRTLVIPSTRAVLEEVFNDGRIFETEV